MVRATHEEIKKVHDSGFVFQIEHKFVPAGDDVKRPASNNVGWNFYKMKTNDAKEEFEVSIIATTKQGGDFYNIAITVHDTDDKTYTLQRNYEQDEDVEKLVKEFYKWFRIGVRLQE